MNVGSLFAGIGGFDLGFERCGMRTLWQVEQDPYCRAVLARHFPRAERFEDVREVGAANLQAVDLICGGFPCQDLSLAGRGAGIDGARSGLWGEYARIVRELRPRYVVVENVPPLLTGKGKRWERAPIGRVLGDLAEMGYDAEWSVLSAREFGAPHLRKRVWIVAYPARDAKARSAPPAGTERQRARPRGARRRARDLSDPSARRRKEVAALHGAAAPGGEAPALGEHAVRSRRAVADADADRRGEGLRESAGERDGSADAFGSGEQPDEGRPVHDADRRGHRPPQGEIRPRGHCPVGPSWWAVEPDVGRVADGVPNRVDRLGALGNALVPQIAEWIGSRILAYEETEVRS